MKIKILVLATSLVLFSTNLSAQSVYVDIGMSVLDTDSTSSTGFGPLGRVGYLFNDKDNSFGIEAEANGLMVDRYNIDTNHNGPSDRDIAFTLGTYLVYSYALPSTKFTLRPRAGVVFPNIGDNIYKDKSSFAYGMSLLYDFRKEFSAYLSYGSFGSGVKGASLGISVNF